MRGDAFAYVLKPVSAADLLERSAGLSISRRFFVRGSASASTSNGRSTGTGSWSNRSRRSSSRSTSGDGSRPGTDSSKQVTGYTRAEMLGADGTALVGIDESPRALPLKAGGAREVRWRRAEAPGAGGSAIVYAVGIDVTDEREMLRRTLRAERLAAVGTMAAGLAHEIRNPLNSASLQLTVLERRLARGDGAETTSPIIHIIKSEIERLERLLRDFLAFSKPRPLDRARSTSRS